MIFPAPAAPADLAPGSSLIVANVILAELPEEITDTPDVVAAKARKAAQEQWLTFAKERADGGGQRSPRRHFEQPDRRHIGILRSLDAA